jgi:hypothetical protein
MADKEHVNRLLRLPKWNFWQQEWNDWRKTHPEIFPNLREPDLREADLLGAKLSEGPANSQVLIAEGKGGANRRDGTHRIAAC